MSDRFKDWTPAERSAIHLGMGLREWVEYFKDARHNGNVEFAKECQKSIDVVIEEHDLDRTVVYGPDPDKPAQKRISDE